MRSRALTGGILAAIMVGLMCVHLGGNTASAHSPHPGLNFWIAVDGVTNCNTKTANASCSLAPGVTFVIGAYLDPLPSDIPNYGGFDVSLRHAGVTPNHDASTNPWPDCAFPAAAYDMAPTDTDIVRFACTVGAPPAGPSTYTGLLGTISFVCAQSGSISMVHGATETDLIEFEHIDPLHIHGEDPNTTETLTINCVQGGATPIPTTPRAGSTTAPTGTPLPPTEQAKATATAKAQATASAKKTPTTGGGGGGGGGLGGGVIAIIVVAAVAVAGGAGFFGWRYLQGRRGASGGGQT